MAHADLEGEVMSMGGGVQGVEEWCGRVMILMALECPSSPKKLCMSAAYGFNFEFSLHSSVNLADLRESCTVRCCGCEIVDK